MGQHADHPAPGWELWLPAAVAPRGWVQPCPRAELQVKHKSLLWGLAVGSTFGMACKERPAGNYK